MINIIVKQAHLERGVINSPFAGPLSLACQEAGLRNAIISTRTVRWQPEKDGPWLISILPLEAVNFLADLRYRDRHEMLSMMRVTIRKQEKWWHTPVQFAIPDGVPIRADQPPTRVGRRSWGHIKQAAPLTMRIRL